MIITEAHSKYVTPTGKERIGEPKLLLRTPNTATKHAEEDGQRVGQVRVVPYAAVINCSALFQSLPGRPRTKGAKPTQNPRLSRK